MNSWVNIQVAQDDLEIIAINQLESSLENIPKQIYKVRELITRFEVCHFKYRQHYEHIIKSIAALKPVIEVDKIGLNHPHHGTNAWKYDETGRSKLGKMYISTLSSWLEEEPSYDPELPKQDTLELRKKINEWLGVKNENKDKLIRMLISRLLWKSVEKYRSGGELSELEYQVEATDICNYVFPENLNKIIRAIGRLKPVKTFDGCGTFNAEIKTFLSKEFEKLCTRLEEDTPSIDMELGTKEPMKIWLVACLAKTIKADLGLTDPLPKLFY